MHKEDALMLNNKHCIALFAIILSLGCNATRHTTSNDNNFSVNQYVPRQLIYDTIDGTFFYENLINSYIEADAVLKGSGFIRGDIVSETAYKNGYFIDGVPYAASLLHKNINIRLDKESIATFYDSLFQKSIREGSNRETKINPFCGAFYKRFQMKVEVVFIDSISQRVPLFIDCNEYNKFKKKKVKNYQMMLLPTYAITKIFSWHEI